MWPATPLTLFNTPIDPDQCPHSSFSIPPLSPHCPIPPLTLTNAPIEPFQNNLLTLPYWPFSMPPLTVTNAPIHPFQYPPLSPHCSIPPLTLTNASIDPFQLPLTNAPIDPFQCHHWPSNAPIHPFQYRHWAPIVQYPHWPWPTPPLTLFNCP